MPIGLPVASIIGSVIGAGADLLSGRSNRRFQERMSSTAYQRAVEDLRRAGLNPALAYSQGGASTPSGSLVQPGRHISEGVTSALRLRMEKKLNDAQVKATEQTGDAAESNALTAARGQTLRENEFNRDTSWYQLQRWLEAQQRMEDLRYTSGSVALLGKELEGASADLEHKKFSADMWKSLQSRMGATFGKGGMRDIANIILMMLQSNAASSAIRFLPGRR